MDLATTYHGIELRNPIVHSASPITGSLDNLRRLMGFGRYTPTGVASGLECAAVLYNIGL